MKKKLFIGIFLIAIVGIGAYWQFFRNESSIFSSKEELPSGYLVLKVSQIPEGYSVKQKAFTANSVLVTLKGDKPEQYLNFIETALGNYENDVARSLNAPRASVVKVFTYEGNEGKIIGNFDQNAYEGSGQVAGPYNEYYLFYNHDGREVEIHTYDVENFTPEFLQNLLENAQVTK